AVPAAFRIPTFADDQTVWWAPPRRPADIRSRLTRHPYGDQAMFVRREAFTRAGGFPDQPLMEDLELSLRLRRLGRIVTVPATVQVSGRRFVAHPLSSMVMMRLVALLYRLGVPARVLARMYGDPR